jgi:hypothetical protein
LEGRWLFNADPALCEPLQCANPADDQVAQVAEAWSPQVANGEDSRFGPAAGEPAKLIMAEDDILSIIDSSDPGTGPTLTFPGVTTDDARPVVWVWQMVPQARSDAPLEAITDEPRVPADPDEIPPPVAGYPPMSAAQPRSDDRVRAIDGAFEEMASGNEVYFDEPEIEDESFIELF